MQLVTHQTGPEGQKVRRLLIEEGADIKKEYYVGLVTDRATQKVVVMASSEGGMDIEEVAREARPRRSQGRRRSVDGPDRCRSRRSRNEDRRAGRIDRRKRAPSCKAVQGYMETDASLAEINPLILDGRRQGDRARRQVQLRFERAVPPPGNRRATATSTKKTRLKSKPPSSTSPTSRSTATSAAS